MILLIAEDRPDLTGNAMAPSLKLFQNGKSSRKSVNKEVQLISFVPESDLANRASDGE